MQQQNQPTSIIVSRSKWICVACFRDTTTGRTTDRRQTDRRQQATHIWSLMWTNNKHNKYTVGPRSTSTGCQVMISYRL